MVTEAKTEDKTASNDKGREAQATAIPESEAKLGHKVFAEAVNSALSTLRGVAENDAANREALALIGKRSEGNGDRIKALATHCLKLTSKGNRADFGAAAMLFKDACESAKEAFMASWVKAHPDQADTARFNVVVPSWPVLQSVFYRGLKAKLNPDKFDSSTKYREAYAKYSKAPENAAERSNRGRKEGSGAKQLEAAKLQLSKPEHVETMGNPLRTAIRTLVLSCAGLTKTQQQEAVGILNEAREAIEELRDADESKSSKTRSQPRASAETRANA